MKKNLRKKKTVKKRTRAKRKSNKTKLLLGLMGLFVLILLGVVFFQWIMPSIHFGKSVQIYEVKDSCGPSPIGGEILHEVSSKADCKIRCVNLCNVRDMDFIGSSFETENRTCYSCRCRCK